MNSPQLPGHRQLNDRAEVLKRTTARSVGTVGNRATIRGVAQTPPAFTVPSGACDCHVHVFGPAERFALAPARPYTPGEAPFEELTRQQRTLGLSRAVIVQPSPYGTDNACCMDALTRFGPGARAVVVVDSGADEESLRRMHAAGVRGLRVNLETAGVQDPDRARHKLEEAARLAAPLGWHVQSYTNLAIINALQSSFDNLPVPIVFDHFAGAEAVAGPDNPELRPVLSLIAAGKAYVKLSAPHRISRQTDSANAGAIARTFLKANPKQVVWGSDWPHPHKPAGDLDECKEVQPFRQIDDGRALNRLADWAGDAATLRRILVDNPARLYGFV